MVLRFFAPRHEGDTARLERRVSLTVAQVAAERAARCRSASSTRHAGAIWRSNGCGRWFACAREDLLHGGTDALTGLPVAARRDGRSRGVGEVEEVGALGVVEAQRAGVRVQTLSETPVMLPRSRRV